MGAEARGPGCRGAALPICVWRLSPTVGGSLGYMSQGRGQLPLLTVPATPTSLPDLSTPHKELYIPRGRAWERGRTP